MRLAHLTPTRAKPGAQSNIINNPKIDDADVVDKLRVHKSNLNDDEHIYSKGSSDDETNILLLELYVYASPIWMTVKYPILLDGLQSTTLTNWQYPS